MNKLMMQQAQALQAKLAKAQEELGGITVETSSGGGMVTVTATAKQQITAIKISPEVVSADDVEMLEDLVLAAVSEALTKAQEAASAHLSAITGGLKIPGLT